MSEFEKRLERYIAGELTSAERIAFEDEVLSTPELADRLYADVSMSSALEIAARARRERAVATAHKEPWWRRIANPLVPAIAVAAIALVVIMQQRESPEVTPVFRAGEGHIEVVEPRGEVETAPARFVWRASETAAFYRFELFDAASTSVFSAVTADSILILDPSIQAPGSGYWTVTPLNDLRVTIGDATLTRYNTTY